jgi:hypothetical protein
MKPIAIFHHCIITSSANREINRDYALNLITDQFGELKRSGLAQAASALYVGVNGGADDAAIITGMAHELLDPRTLILTHGKSATTEIPTLNVIRDWVRGHPGWYVLYHHTKGVSTPNQADNWRRRMQKNCVTDWRRCIKALIGGADACGCHWLTPERHGHTIRKPFFGGTFSWATTEYLKTLPPLPPAKWENRYEAEMWIGTGPRRPRVVDFHPGWPTP